MLNINTECPRRQIMLHASADLQHSWSWNQPPKHLDNRLHSLLAGRSYSTHPLMDSDSNAPVPGHTVMDMLWLGEFDNMKWPTIILELNSQSQWVVSSILDLADWSSSMHRLHWLASGVENVAVGLMIWTKKLLPDTDASQTGCPPCSIHWNWYCLVTMLLGSLQMAKLGVVLIKSHWNSTTTETKEDVFVRSPDASHTIVKVLIFTGMLGSASPGGTKPTETSPLLENSVVLPRSLIVMDGHDAICAFVNDIKARPSTMMKGYSPLRSIILFARYCGSCFVACSHGDWTFLILLFLWDGGSGIRESEGICAHAHKRQHFYSHAPTVVEKYKLPYYQNYASIIYQGL